MNNQNNPEMNIPRQNNPELESLRIEYQNRSSAWPRTK